VKIDDAEISSSSVSVPLKVNPGKHEVVARLGTEEKRAKVDLAEGELKSLELLLANAGPATPPPPPPPPVEPETRTSPLVWIGLATAGLGTIVGATTGILAFGVQGDVASRCEGGVRCPPATHADIDRGATFGTISTVSFILAGAGAVVLVYGLLSPSRVPSGATSAQLGGLVGSTSWTF
jgi:hypothetical protein